MHNKNVIVCIIIGAIFLQCFFSRINGNESYWYAFAYDLKIGDSVQYNMAKLLTSFLPIAFLFFFYWGIWWDLTIEGGRLLVIRGVSRQRLIARNVAKIYLTVALFVLAQCAVFMLCNSDQERNDLMDAGKTLLAYYLMIGTVVLLQQFLELFMRPQYALLVVDLFFTGSIMMGDILFSNSHFSLWKLILFPNLGFGGRNLNYFQSSSPDYLVAMSFMMGIGVFVTLLSLKIAIKRDFY